jgi:hypothetical protein
MTREKKTVPNPIGEHLLPLREIQGKRCVSQVGHSTAIVSGRKKQQEKQIMRNAEETSLALRLALLFERP